MRSTLTTLVILVGMVSILGFFVSIRYISTNGEGKVSGNLSPPSTATRPKKLRGDGDQTEQHKELTEINGVVYRSSDGIPNNNAVVVETRHSHSPDSHSQGQSLESILLDPYPFPSAGRKRTEFPQSTYSSFLHQVHIPKCGGTSYSAVLRRAVCSILLRKLPALSESDIDCCENPGMCSRPTRICDHAMTGCHNHIPQLNEVEKSQFKFTLMRDPVSRVRSAFLYRCHNPNNDCYHVREEYCQMRKRGKECGEGIGKVWTFEEYLELEEYHNIYTRMFGTAARSQGVGTFPYTADSPVGREELEAAKRVLEVFDLVGLTELYDVSVAATLQLLETELEPTLDLRRDRAKEDSNERVDLANKIDSDVALQERIREVEKYDIELYEWAKERFCKKAREMKGEMWNQLQQAKAKEDIRAKFDTVCV